MIITSLYLKCVQKDLISYWKSLLKEASQCDNISRLELLLYCAMSILKNTKRSKYEDLQILVCEAWGLIAKGAQLADIQILIGIICKNFESINDLKGNDGMKIMPVLATKAFHSRSIKLYLIDSYMLGISVLLPHLITMFCEKTKVNVINM